MVLRRSHGLGICETGKRHFVFNIPWWPTNHDSWRGMWLIWDLVQIQKWFFHFVDVEALLLTTRGVDVEFPEYGLSRNVVWDKVISMWAEGETWDLVLVGFKRVADFAFSEVHDLYFIIGKCNLYKRKCCMDFLYIKKTYIWFLKISYSLGFSEIENIIFQAQ